MTTAATDTRTTRAARGRELLRGGNPHAWPVRRFGELLSAFISDIAADAESPTEVERQLARRFAGLALNAELFEAELAAGKPVKATEYRQLCRTLSSLAAQFLPRRRKLSPEAAALVGRLKGGS